MPTVKSLGEVGLIRRFAARVRGSSRVLVGIGDDTAVLRGAGRELWLFASDMLVEGVHFRRKDTPAQWIGWKALAANVSDVAAMGGRPVAAVVSLGVPATTPVAFTDGLGTGLLRCARRFGVAIVGGDTVRSPQVVIDVAILGRATRSHLTLRRGARAGDRLFVTGHLGGSYVSGRHARFMPRVAEAQALLARVRVHAMMDLSDGLASDLWQMAQASRVTLRVDGSRIPVSRAAKTLTHALMDGEDFELLFAVSAREAARVPRRIGACLVTEIGEVRGTSVARVELVQSDGRIRPLHPRGFAHF